MDLWVLRGGGSNAVGQRPFQLLRGVVSEFIAAARTDASLAARVYEQLGEQRETVVAALPQLGHELGWQAGTQLRTEAFGPVRSVQALTRFLATLGVSRAARLDRSRRLPMGR